MNDDRLKSNQSKPLALTAITALIIMLGLFPGFQPRPAYAAVGDLTASDHEGQLKVAGVVGSYSNGNITQYTELESINFHLTLTNDAAGAATGDFIIQWTGDNRPGPNTCLFFQQMFSLGTWNGEANAVELISGATPTVTTVGSPAVSGDEWTQQIHVEFTGTGSATMYYYLTLSNDAGNCGGSSQHSSLGNANVAGDFGNIGAQRVPIPAQGILDLPSLTMTKLIDRDDNGSYESTATAGEYQFTLAGPAAFGPTQTDSIGQALFDNIAPDGSYTISEGQLTGSDTYELDSVSGDCTLLSAVNGTATIALAANTTQQQATCTFYNSLPFVQNPSITVKKSSTTTSLNAPGTVTYSYVVTNTGNVSISGLSLSDDNDNDDMVCGSDTLTVAPDAGSTTTCTATHTFTQSELDANGSPTADSGKLTNNVTASSNEAPNATDRLDIPITQSPSITVVKSSTTTSLNAPGTVTYSYVVTNTGNVSISGLSLSDDNDNDDMVCGSDTLTVAPDAGSTTTCTATHTFTQSELDANGSPTADSGKLTNNVTASSNEAPNATDRLDIPITQNPSITIRKSSTTTSLNAPGTVTYSYVVTNTGNVSISGLSLSDDNDNDDMVCGSDTLTVAPDAGSTTTCTATHTFTQSELDANGSPTADSGKLTNNVTASSNEAPNATDRLDIPITQSPSITVVKSSTTTSLNAPGTVTYSYVVTNTGNVSISGLSLSDDNDNDDMVCGSDTLTVAPDAGSTTTCTATHTFTQAELDANGSPTADSGKLTNNVTASSNEAPNATDRLDIPITQNPSITIRKSSTTTSLNAPGTVTYSYVVTNTGNVSISGLSLSDDNDNDDMVCGSDTLTVAPDAGSTTTCTATHTFTQSELDANGSPTADSGKLTNNVTASSNEAPNATDRLDIPITQSPSITVVKSSTTTSLNAPGTVTYSYVVTNTGNVSISGLSLSDDNDNDDMVCGSDTLTVAPDAGSTTTCTATHTFTQAELDAGGNLTNIVTASSNEAPDATDKLDIPISGTPSITVVKSSVTTGLTRRGR